jgi:predicted PurR-regulated permease PerM
MILTFITFAIFAVLCLFINEQLAQIRDNKTQIKYLQSSVEHLNTLINQRTQHNNMPTPLIQRLISTTNENTRKIANLDLTVRHLTRHDRLDD